MYIYIYAYIHAYIYICIYMRSPPQDPQLLCFGASAAKLPEFSIFFNFQRSSPKALDFQISKCPKVQPKGSRFPTFQPQGTRFQVSKFPKVQPQGSRFPNFQRSSPKALDFKISKPGTLGMEIWKSRNLEIWKRQRFFNAAPRFFLRWLACGFFLLCWSRLFFMLGRSFFTLGAPQCATSCWSGLLFSAGAVLFYAGGPSV